MTPMKYALSDMKRAANPRKETTRLSALATGLRLMTTAAPKTSMSSANIQNNQAGIIGISDFGFRLWERLSFLRVPFGDDAMHDTADLKQLVLVMHHVFAGEASDGVIFAQEDGLLGTDFLAHAAVDAADHIDIE